MASESHDATLSPTFRLPQGAVVLPSLDGSAARRAFWVAQLLGWVAYALILYVGFYPSLQPGIRLKVLASKLLRVPIFIGATLVLLPLYRRTLAGSGGLARFIPTALAACGLLGAISFATHGFLAVTLGVFSHESSAIDWPTVPKTILDFAFALLAWTAVYAIVTIWRASDERAREAVESRRRAQEAELHAQEAQLQMLAYQLQPHFLFNALNTVRALIGDHDTAAREVVTRLASFLRYSLLTTPDRLVTLGDEVDAMRAYLDIERVRFGERLTVCIDVPPDAAAAGVPAFVIHPLVENAVKYGRADAAAPLEVRIEAQVRGGRLRVVVSNTGRLARSPEAAGGTGIGLRNVRARLAHLYQTDHRVELIEDAGWVRAIVEVPASCVTR
jgi:two-component system, LytTR family, sensor kinase